MKSDLRNWIAFRVLLLLVGVCAAWPATSFAAEVKIVNPSKDPMKLSDLIVYGAKIGQTEIILHRGFAIDDEDIAGGETKSFPTSFPVIAAATSIMKNGKEADLVLRRLDVKSGFQPVGWLGNAIDGSELFPSIDSALAGEAPAEGTVLSFIAGLNPQLPGWFVGTSLDLDQGIVLDGFTGDAVVLSDAEIAAVPEPTSLVLLSAALAVLWVLQRACDPQHRNQEK